MPIDTNLNDIYILYGENIPNYFNRRILFYNSLADYITAAGTGHSELKEDVNFNPADGVSTFLNVNSDQGDKFTYLLVVDPTDNSIVSRWFIIEADRNLGGQYRLQLRRDVVAESCLNEKFITQAPVYVEKGILNDSDPLIVNSEGMNFNQIKRSETTLESNPLVKWGYVVGYFEKGANVATITVTLPEQEPPESTTAAAIATATGIDVSKINDMLAGGTIPIATSDLFIHYGILIGTGIPSSLRGIKISLKNTSLHTTAVVENSPAYSYNERIGTLNVSSIPQNSGVADYINSQTDSDILTALNDVIDNDIPNEKLYTNTALSALNAYEGKIILYGGVYYKMHITSTGQSAHSEVVISQHENTFFDNAVLNAVTTEKNNWAMYLNYQIQTIGISLETYSQTSGTLTTKISSSARTLQDAPYSMFVIPYGDNVRFHMDGSVGDMDQAKILTKLQALQLASQIAIELGQKLYDIQLLPYQPPLEIPLWSYFIVDKLYYFYEIKSLYDDDPTIEGVLYDPIKDGSNNEVGAIMYCTQSNFTTSINQKLSSSETPKIESQCNFYRLCSPNYNGVFEFNLAKNGMSVDSFLVNCTYKPINPLIRIQPSFKGLYGSDFVDGRGLICGGDFSLPIIKDAWITYQQNNKNFADIFARDIQNLDVAQKQEALKEAIQLGSGIVGGTAGGAIAGAKYGGGMGAVAGAALGLTAGSAGAMIDARLGQERRAEAKDYLIDRFNMNLQAIKALPQSLARNSSFTVINKIFPFLEYYSCTPEEKEALQRKINFDGMTVGRIDYMGNFESLNNAATNYFKGQLIRAVGIEEDTHYINALYEELAKGVYI